MRNYSIDQKNKLSDHQLAILSSEMLKYHKSTGLTYVLWLFFGTLGIHKFYLGQTGWGVAYLLLGLLGWAFSFAVFFIFVIPIVVLLLIDLSLKRFFV